MSSFFPQQGWEVVQVGEIGESDERETCHCGAPAAAGTGVLRALVAADRTGEPVRGPRAVDAGKAEIPERGEVRETECVAPTLHSVT